LPHKNLALLLSLVVGVAWQVPGWAAPVADNPPGSRLDTLTGAIDVQAGTLNGQLTLGRGTATLGATLTDAGPQGQLSLAAPGVFAATASVLNGRVEAQAALCVGAREIAVSALRGMGVHVELQQTDADPAACQPTSATRAPVAILSLDRHVHLAQEEPPPPSDEAVQNTQNTVLDGARRLLVLWLISWLLFLYSPNLWAPVSTAARTSPWSRIGLGLCLVLTVPVIAVLVFIMGLGAGLWWVGLLIAAVYVCVLEISMAFAGLVLGAWLVERIHEPRVPPMAGLAVGVAALTVFGLLPYVGSIVNVVALLFGVGALMLAPRACQSRPGLVAWPRSPQSGEDAASIGRYVPD
jgi:hypothetical protein